MPTATGHTTAIRATRVIGTEVRGKDGKALGKVEDVILDKLDNSIMFAVVGFGGVLGIGEKYHPLPWSVLDYDPAEDAFIVPYTGEELKSAPHDTIGELTRNDGQIARDKAYDYYQVPRYWN